MQRIQTLAVSGHRLLCNRHIVIHHFSRVQQLNIAKIDIDSARHRDLVGQVRRRECVDGKHGARMYIANGDLGSETEGERRIANHIQASGDTAMRFHTVNQQTVLQHDTVRVDHHHAKVVGASVAQLHLTVLMPIAFEIRAAFLRIAKFTNIDQILNRNIAQTHIRDTIDTQPNRSFLHMQLNVGIARPFHIILIIELQLARCPSLESFAHICMRQCRPRRRSTCKRQLRIAKWCTDIVQEAILVDKRCHIGVKHVSKWTAHCKRRV
mmetsp:Transcript_32833/g.53291  ORF Transcript_32833/g.53291 Transcript_32833/m.53291 type:complete len:267 (+) Transcript_32833:110-910(+)